MNESPDRTTDVEFYWVTDFYDIPLHGICWRHGKLAEFFVIDEGGWDAEGTECQVATYAVYRLSWFGKLTWLARKWLFEFFVGEHWSYERGRRKQLVKQRQWRPRWFTTMYYKLFRPLLAWKITHRRR